MDGEEAKRGTETSFSNLTERFTSRVPSAWQPSLKSRFRETGFEVSVPRLVRPSSRLVREIAKAADRLSPAAPPSFCQV